ncbi:hypothetical protein NOVO_00380 [Rickettsiales bacterium Ac37b]|nr:hypothetical protein NOVO_00380 [Rickettsiales bacterium Ac37b]
MKKFLIVLAILISYLFAKDWLDDRPFKFERYKDDKQFDAALIKQFPLGSDMKEMIKLFEQSGAECADRSHEEDKPKEYQKYDIYYWCKYNSDWLSFDPLGVYEIWFLGDKNYKLMHISGSTYPAFVI